MRPHRRTTLAAVLVGVAVLLPTIAWYVAGSNDATRRAEALREQAEFALRDEAEREAVRLGTRLEELRRQETQRPFYHYQTLYHDPRGAAEGLSVTPSPLVSGATDPLVWAHFQIDETGLVTLPKVSERFPELSSDDDFAVFCSRLTELQSAVVMDVSDFSDTFAEEDRVLTLTDREWHQIRRADAVYASITGRGTESAPNNTIESGDIAGIAIRVRPLAWKTIVLGSGPALAALRDVHTPDGVVLQGFAIASGAIAQSLASSPLPLQFSPGPPISPTAVTELVADTGWILTAEMANTTAPSIREGREIVNQFRRTFGITATAVLLAAAAVIWILMQTDRLARQRARFAAAAAHELKTPLSGLLLHAEMLSENLGDPDHRAQYAVTLGSEAARLGRVVTNMLDLARLERGALVAHPHPGDLGELVRRRVDGARSRLEGAGVTVDLSIEPKVPPALFDDDAVSQILENLMDNAEKHTRSIADRWLKITLEMDGGNVLVRVADNGPGISRHERKGLFRPFDRPVSSDRTPGLGLGLALARSLARAQGGELDYVPADAGATFVLTVPKA